MKFFSALPVLLSALCVAAPATGWSDDHHSHHYDYHHGYGYHGYRSYRPYGYYSPYPYVAAPFFGLSINTSPTYYRGEDRSDDRDNSLAMDVQEALAHKGFYRGEVDGDVGPGTRSAIREYQYRNGLEVTGRIDRSLLRSLDLD